MSISGVCVYIPLLRDIATAPMALEIPQSILMGGNGLLVQ